MSKQGNAFRISIIKKYGSWQNYVKIHYKNERFSAIASRAGRISHQKRTDPNPFEDRSLASRAGKLSGESRRRRAQERQREHDAN